MYWVYTNFSGKFPNTFFPGQTGKQVVWLFVLDQCFPVTCWSVWSKWVGDLVDFVGYI